MHKVGTRQRCGLTSAAPPIVRNAEAWGWQLLARCRGTDTSVFFHPDGERGLKRRKRKKKRQTILRPMPRHHAMPRDTRCDSASRMASGEALPKTSDTRFSSTRSRVLENEANLPTGSAWMFKRNNQFPQPIRPAMSDRQVRSPIGHFAGEAWACASQCRTYRYRLVRVWDSHKPRLGVVGHSWATTNEWRSDFTVRRCIGFARAWGYGGVDVGNLFGLQAADPRKLATLPSPSARTMMRTWPRCAPTTISSCWHGAAHALSRPRSRGGSYVVALQ